MSTPIYDSVVEDLDFNPIVGKDGHGPWCTEACDATPDHTQAMDRDADEQIAELDAEEDEAVEEEVQKEAEEQREADEDEAVALTEPEEPEGKPIQKRKHWKPVDPITGEEL